MKAFPAPEFIQFYPTFRCNQNCSFCFNSTKSHVSDISFENASGLTDIMISNGIYDLDIMGGEPFLLEWMPEFIEETVKKNVTINISTNGSMPNISRRLRGIPMNMLNIGISLEGSSADIHNSLTRSKNFTSAIESIKILNDMGFDPIAKTVINKNTVPDIQSLISLLKSLGVRQYYMIHMDLFHNIGSDKSSAFSYPDFLAFYQSIRSDNPGINIYKVNASCFEKHSIPLGVRCAGGVKKLSVMPDGSAYPCNLFHHIPDFSLGNIFRHDFGDIWQNRKLDLFRKHEGNKCTVSGCQKRNSCTGGCPAHCLYHKGNPDGPDIRCMQ